MSLVSGSAVIADDYFKSLVAALHNLLGGPSELRIASRSRAPEAVLRMKAQARCRCGMIVNVKLQTFAVPGHPAARARRSARLGPPRRSALRRALMRYENPLPKASTTANAGRSCPFSSSPAHARPRRRAPACSSWRRAAWPAPAFPLRDRGGRRGLPRLAFGQGVEPYLKAWASASRGPGAAARASHRGPLRRCAGGKRLRHARRPHRRLPGAARGGAGRECPGDGARARDRPCATATRSRASALGGARLRPHAAGRRQRRAIRRIGHFPGRRAHLLPSAAARRRADATALGPSHGPTGTAAPTSFSGRCWRKPARGSRPASCLSHPLSSRRSRRSVRWRLARLENRGRSDAASCLKFARRFKEAAAGAG